MDPTIYEPKILEHLEDELNNDKITDREEAFLRGFLGT